MESWTEVQIKRSKMDMDCGQGDQMDEEPSIELASGVDRTDDFPVSQLTLQYQGAEARLYRSRFFGKSVIVKERFPKSYRHPNLDDQLRRDRMKAEIRCMARCRAVGIAVPPLYFVDPSKNRLVLGYLEDAITVREYICKIYDQHGNSIEDQQRFLFPLSDEIGRLLAKLHSNDMIHGDLTTSNILIQSSPSNGDADQEYRLILIDFGLSYVERLPEDKGVDLYVLEKAFLSTHPESEAIFDRILNSYGKNYTSGGGGKKALSKLAEVRLRGRKREMIG